jgi:hypothetical protein
MGGIQQLEGMRYDHNQPSYRPVVTLKRTLLKSPDNFRRVTPPGIP